ncbi:MAG: bifunctional (p)ppGpp synthetase/guanosine-3',5'-bis(diphosphate) 3'-pyrophosphohydrolase [Gallionella sp.]
MDTKKGPQFDDTASWLATLEPVFSLTEIDLLQRAGELVEPLYAGHTDLTGTPLLQHQFDTATILLSMNMDAETIAATLLYAAPEYLPNWQEVIESAFGKNIKSMVESISRLEQIRQLGVLHNVDFHEHREHTQQIESLRKMLLAMVEDIRVVLIKLAERTHTLRCLSGARAEQQILIAQETQSVFAPLANRLGVWQIKWELEDLSVRYLEPELYKEIAKLLDERRVDRENYISRVVARLKQALADAGIKAAVTGRPKHIYSIINKMKRKQLAFSELYDVRAVRILVEDVESCYAALSLVQDLWQPIAREFDDYIAHPKSNNYRSLHTAVTDSRGQAFEVQIRTQEMHQHSELGVAAHWRYKEGGKSDASLNEKIIWLRQILEWEKDVLNQSDLQAQFKTDLFQDQVYVLTPKGRVMALPCGATPVDFAYSLHTDLGHRTRGAKVDGRIVPLNYTLQNGQRVDILTHKLGAPSRDWLNPTLGFLHGSRARAKVRAWFTNQNIGVSLAQGRVQLDRELHRLGVTALNQEKLAQRMHFNKLDDLLAAIGRNTITMHRIAVAVQEEQPNKLLAISKPVFKAAFANRRATGVLVEGVNNLMTRTAKCCGPSPPDLIVAYVTHDRGITLHRQDCAYVQRLIKIRPERLLSAVWHE